MISNLFYVTFTFIQDFLQSLHRGVNKPIFVGESSTEDVWTGKLSLLSRQEREENIKTLVRRTVGCPQIHRNYLSVVSRLFQYFVLRSFIFSNYKYTSFTFSNQKCTFSILVISLFASVFLNFFLFFLFG